MQETTSGRLGTSTENRQIDPVWDANTSTAAPIRAELDLEQGYLFDFLTENKHKQTSAEMGSNFLLGLEQTLCITLLKP